MRAITLSERDLRSALCCPACKGELCHGRAIDCSSCGRAYSRDGSILRLLHGPDDDAGGTSFYSVPDPRRYGRRARQPSGDLLRPFLSSVDRGGVVLEIGSGGGSLQGVHPGYVALDVSLYALRRFSQGHRVQASASALPFRADVLDAVLTWATLEHVPDPEGALAEIHRCLRPGGRAFIFPAWFVRPWAASALHVRPFATLSPVEKLKRLTLPIRDSRPYWFVKVLPRRIRREAALSRGRERMPFERRVLSPNLETYLISDSDAFSSMDPQAVSAFFLSRGYQDLRRSSSRSRLLYGYEPVMVMKPR